jgi:hypothetical protein
LTDPEEEHILQHVTIYCEPGRYGGWPANYGMWAWGQEVVLGYIVGHFNLEGGYHARDRSKPLLTYQSRSLDGGRTWDVQPFPGRTPGGRGLSADEHLIEELWVANHLDGPEGPQPSPGGINFTHPDFALMCARTNLHAGSRSWFYVSYDRCRSWQGPYAFPLWGQTGISARTDYFVDDRNTCTFFLTAVKPNGREGWVCCVRTGDGGKSFDFRSWVTPEPEGYTIMPAGLRLSPRRLLCAVRASGPRSGPAHGPAGLPARPPCWIDLYASEDDGESWRYLSRPVLDSGLGGNPPTLTRLHDGRLLLTYGFRNPPFAILARFSEDEGASWSEPLTLRAGAGNHDIGYPRTVQLGDGTVVTAYYWNDDAAGDRYIAATVWKP